MMGANDKGKSSITKQDIYTLLSSDQSQPIREMNDRTIVEAFRKKHAIPVIEKRDDHKGFYGTVPRNGIDIREGIDCRRKGLIGRAEEIFKQGLEADPDNSRIYAELGKTYRIQGKLPEAENMLQKAIRLNPNEVDAYIELGYLFQSKNDLDRAIHYMNEAIKIDPKCNAYDDLCSFYQRQGNLGLAEEIAKKSVGLNPNYYMRYIILARIYYAQRKFQEAKEAYLAAIPLTPEDPINDPYNELWRCYLDGKTATKEEIEAFYKDSGLNVKIASNRLIKRRGENEMFTTITEENYSALYSRLKDKGITYVAMNYPTRDINEIKSMFRRDEEIIFISNEKNFKEALMKSDYEEFFIDKCYRNFGHATVKGNRMIAENVATVILNSSQSTGSASEN